MRIKSTVTAIVFALGAAGAPALVQGLDLTFLDQAPIRFFNDADLSLLSDAADQALDKAEEGEEVAWSNDQTGSSGTVTPVRDFTRDGKNCRRLQVVSMARKATRGSASSQVDFCKVDGTWKILTIVR
jgi:surface antigen